MNTKSEVIERYASCKTEQNIYEIDGKKYIVTRHFAGDKNINEVIAKSAVSRAKREMGLSGG